MSNISLIQRLDNLCREYEQGEITLRDLGVNVEFHAEAFEAIAFQDYKTLKDIAYSLSIEAMHAEDGFDNESETRKLIGDLRAALTRLATIWLQTDK